ncbi:MAG: T9SS type A sorting domain-containing protein [Saprospiraceae bacterium]|nr:T9SS type A sorting domain-containing protein [Saprospiraceae bacterium]
MSIVDANGLAIRDSIQIIFNNKAYCNGYIKYENKVLSTNFNKNPLFGLVNWNYEIVQNKKIILSKKGSTVEGFLKVDFDNQSLTDTAFFTLKFSMKGQNYDIAEQKITYKIPPKSGFPLAIKNSKEYRFCSLDSSIVLKSAVIGGTPPLTYNWSNGASGEQLDSIVVKPTQTTKYSVTVVDAAGKSIVNEIKINIGDSLKLYSLVLPDSICPKNISIPINANNTNAPFELFTMLEKNDGTFEYDTIVHSSSKTFINYDVQNYSNQNYEKLVVKLKVPQNGYCLDNTLIEATDTVILKPTPKFQYRTPIKRSICFNDSLKIELPIADSSNLSVAKISYLNNFWINELTQGKVIFNTLFGNSDVNYISNFELPIYYQDINYYFLNQFRWNIKYDFNECEGYDVKMDDSIFTIKNTYLRLYSKYQNIKSGQEIQPINIWPNSNFVNLQWQFSDNQLSGSLFNCTTNPLKGNLVNKKDYTQFLKIYINGEIEGCKTSQDTAYIQVNSLYAPALYQLETSDVFIEGHRIARKITEISENQLDVSFAPNPVQDKIYIKLDLKSDQQSEFIIYSVEGKIIAQFSEPCNAGRNRIEIQTANLQSGAYIMEIRNQEGNQVIKFIKE